MLSLSMLNMNEKAYIEVVKGNEDTKRFLNNLGFVEKSEVEVISKANGNVIVSVKGTRIAIGRSMANKIFVKQ